IWSSLPFSCCIIEVIHEQPVPPGLFCTGSGVDTMSSVWRASTIARAVVSHPDPGSAGAVTVTGPFGESPPSPGGCALLPPGGAPRARPASTAPTLAARARALTLAEAARRGRGSHLRRQTLPLGG